MINTPTTVAVAAPVSQISVRLRTTLQRAGDEVDEVDDAYHHQQQTHEVQERQDARVPQQANSGEAVARDEGGSHQCDAHNAQPCAVEVAAHDAANESQERQTATD